MEGTVTDGMGKGEEFVALEGYAEQFERRLGYEPFPGTLNLSLTESLDGRLDGLSPIRIEEWERDGRSFGAVDCYPASIRRVAGREADGTATDGVPPANADDVPIHLIVPHRTGHDPSTAELISPVRLRDAFALADDDAVRLRIESRSSSAVV